MYDQKYATGISFHDAASRYDQGKYSWLQSVQCQGLLYLIGQGKWSWIKKQNVRSQELYSTRLYSILHIILLLPVFWILMNLDNILACLIGQRTGVTRNSWLAKYMIIAVLHIRKWCATAYEMTKDYEMIVDSGFALIWKTTGKWKTIWLLQKTRVLLSFWKIFFI